MGDPRDIGSMFHFSQSVHADDECEDLARRFPELLRNVAASVEKLGNVEVQDMTFRHEITPADEYLTMTVYYNRLDSPNLRIVPLHGD